VATPAERFQCKICDAWYARGPEHQRTVCAVCTGVVTRIEEAHGPVDESVRRKPPWLDARIAEHARRAEAELPLFPGRR
jgi:hypothetical protein